MATLAPERREERIDLLCPPRNAAGAMRLAPIRLLQPPTARRAAPRARCNGCAALARTFHIAQARSKAGSFSQWQTACRDLPIAKASSACVTPRCSLII